MRLKMKQFLIITSSVLSFLVTTTNSKTFEEDLTITLQEKKILDKFKELVQDRLPHDYMQEEAYLIRWLRAKYFNIYDSEKALMSHVAWRRDNRMDTISQEDWADYERDYKYYLESRDKEGKPVLYLSVKSWDLRKASLSGNRERFARYIDKGLDDACALVRDLGNKYKNVSQGILLINAGGFNLIQHGCLQCISTLLRVVVQYEAHYPGCADKLIIVNVPNIAEPIVQTLRAALHPITSEGLIVYGTNKKHWQKILREYFDPDQLPPDLGGTKIYNGDDYDDYNV